MTREKVKNILITGSGGFIGKNLNKYLSGQYNLLTPRSYELDLTDENAVRNYFSENEIDFVIHCATQGGARGIKDKDDTVDANLSMVNNILRYKNPEIRVILFGSGAMYGKSRPLHKVKEETVGEFIPEDLYGKSKMLIAQMIKNRKDVLMLNIFACYGYGEKELRFPSYAINQVLAGKDIVINQDVIFDYLFVEDMQRIVAHFIENPPFDNIINITPAQSVSLSYIAKIASNLSDKYINITISNPQMNNEYTGDNSLLLKNYPECVFTPIETGIKKLFEYNSLKETVIL